MLVTELERVDDSEELVDVSAGGGGVGEEETDDVVGVDCERERSEAVSVRSFSV